MRALPLDAARRVGLGRNSPDLVDVAQSYVASRAQLPPNSGMWSPTCLEEQILCCHKSPTAKRASERAAEEVSCYQGGDAHSDPVRPLVDVDVCGAGPCFGSHAGMVSARGGTVARLFKCLHESVRRGDRR